MNTGFKVKTLLFSSGERFPVLVDRLGQPVFEVVTYSLTELRARNQATNTISNSLRALLVFYLFLDLRQINLQERLDAGQLLSLGEIEELSRLCRIPVERISDQCAQSENLTKPVVSLEKIRMGSHLSSEEEIVPASAANRLRCIRDYLEWMVTERLLRKGSDWPFRTVLESAGKNVSNAINARLPSKAGGSLTGLREGLEPAEVSRMLQIINPHSPDNPWQDEHSRYRNALAILWLHYLGLRRGELLGVRISDIDFRESTVVVARRADDPTDPRKYQPNVKTRARKLPLSPDLLGKTHSYIMNQRAAVPGIRKQKHDFLLVASDTGDPLSIPSLSKVFDVLRKKCPELPRGLSPHVLRHTWNDRFSETMDKKQVAEETEKRLRAELMGWSPTSATPAIYTRRHTRKRAQEVSLEMQTQMIEGGGDE